MIRRTIKGTVMDAMLPIGTINVEFTYMCEVDPLALHVRFLTDEDRHWVIGRDLVAQGLHMNCGEGDVRIVDSADKTFITLCPPAGVVTVVFPKMDLKGFIDQTYAAIPAGTEGKYLGDPDAEWDMLKEDAE